MDDTERPRSIRLPQWLWDEIDRDSVRCRRSAVKQLEVVLTAYYRKDDTQLNLERLAELTGVEVATKTRQPILKHKDKANTEAKRKAQ